MVISELHDAPQFAAKIADRAWHAWWVNSGVSLREYSSAITRMAQNKVLPLALVAHIGDEYLGSVQLVDNDLETRPQFSPWIAALWVEPNLRRQGIGAKLIDAALEKAANLGHHTCYLCATETNSPYYIAGGFHLLEPNVDGLNVFTKKCR